ncbi:MAG: phytanoyl-CoA dioxygenase family protein [Bacteroidia bacterium]
MTTILRDPELAARFWRDGYITLPFLGEDALRELRQLFTEVRTKVALSGFASTTFSPDLELKEAMFAQVQPLYEERVNALFANYKLLGTSFLQKDSGQPGFMPLHQDWTVTEEAHHRTVTIWIPLEDCGIENGAIQMLPGSHRWTNILRGPNFPPAITDIDPILREGLVTLPLKAGEAVIFDHSIMHCSLLNTSGRPRIAVTYGLTHQEAPLRFWYHHPSDPPNRLEQIAVPDDFFLHYHNIRQRPEIGQSLGFYTQDQSRLTAAEARQLTQGTPVNRPILRDLSEKTVLPIAIGLLPIVMSSVAETSSVSSNTSNETASPHFMSSPEGEEKTSSVFSNTSNETASPHVMSSPEGEKKTSSVNSNTPNKQDPPHGDSAKARKMSRLRPSDSARHDSTLDGNYALTTNETWDQALEKQGYILFPLLNEDTVAALKAFFRANQPGEINRFHASVHHRDHSYRQKMDAELQRVVKPLMDSLLQDGEVLGGSFIAKPSGSGGILPPHADWNIVDERFGRSYNLWIPLVDTSIANGAVHIIPGSHAWMDDFRGPGIPNPYAKHDATIWSLMQPLDMKAGTALLYDHRLLHASPVNQTPDLRLACVMGVKPRRLPMRYYCGENGLIKAYESNPEFYILGDPENGPAQLPFGSYHR